MSLSSLRKVLGASLAAIALGGCGLSLQTLPKFSGSLGSTYPIHATFSDVLNLPAEAQVHIGAEVVGAVTSITTQHFAAHLVLAIKKGTHLPVGTTAQVRFDNPLGDEYVLLSPPAHAAGGFLTAGASIPLADTGIAPSVEDTLAALSSVLNGGGINQLQTIVHEVNQTFNGNQPHIRALLGSINAAVTSLAGGRSSVDNALAAIGNLSQRLNAGSAVVTASIGTLAPAVGVLASENTQISQLFTSLDQLTAVANKVADQSGQNAVNDVKAVLPVAEQLVAVDAQIAPDVADLSRFEANIPKTAPGDYLQVGLTVNVELPTGDFSPSPTQATAGTTRASAGPASITALLSNGLG